MDLDDFHELTGVIFNILGILAIVIGGLWAYTRYAVERGLLPAAQLDIECSKLGSFGECAILDIGIHIKNVGSSTLVADELSIDIRYLRESDQLEFFGSPATGRLMFPHSLKRDILSHQALSEDSDQAMEKNNGKTIAYQRKTKRGISVMSHDTFVQSDVDQRYSFTTKLPNGAKCVSVYASFEYAQKPRPIQDKIYKLSRNLGLISYSLQHVDRPHTAERVF